MSEQRAPLYEKAKAVVEIWQGSPTAESSSEFELAMDELAQELAEIDRSLAVLHRHRVNISVDPGVAP